MESKPFLFHALDLLFYSLAWAVLIGPLVGNLMFFLATGKYLTGEMTIEKSHSPGWSIAFTIAHLSAIVMFAWIIATFWGVS